MASSRDRRQPRHGRRPDPELDPHDPELDSYLAALAPGSEPGGTGTTGLFGTAQVLQVRLPALRLEQLSLLAAERGSSPAALATDWVLERLDREDAPTGPLPVTAREAGRRARFRRR